MCASPWLSIIIPTYRNVDLLIRLLDSIDPQPGIEVIVIDDCSPEWPADRELLETKYPTIKLTSNKENSGAGYSRNVGMRLAQGEWVLFADSDDRFLEGAFGVIFEHMLGTNENVDIIFFSPVAVGHDGARSDRAKDYQALVQGVIVGKDESWIRVKWFPPWSKLIRSSALRSRSIWFDEVPASNDLNFSVKIGVAAREIEVSEREVYEVSETETSLTKTKSIANERSRLEALLRYNKFLRTAGKEYQIFANAWGLPVRLLARQFSREHLRLFFMSYKSYLGNQLCKLTKR